jgi:phage protein D
VVGSETIPNITLKRVTQKEKSDLAFLKDLASEYGIIFKIESTQSIVFFKESDLEAQPSSRIIKKTDLSNYKLSRKAAGSYKAAEISYQDAESGEFIDVLVSISGDIIPDGEEGGSEDLNSIATESILKIRTRCESFEQALLKAEEGLYQANKTRFDARLTVAGGDPKLAAGMVFTLAGFDFLNGNYLITKVNHKLTRSEGFISDLEARRILG